MGALKNYLLDLLAHCSEHQFGQDAVEWAITSGFVKLTYDLDQDLRTIMGEPGRPETGQYSPIVDAYQRVIHDQLMESDLAVLDSLIATPPTHLTCQIHDFFSSHALTTCVRPT